MMPDVPPFKRIFTMPLAAAGVIFMLAEEVIWDMLVAFGNWIGDLAFMRDLESRIRALPPYAAGFALLTPAAFFFPVKLLAVYSMATGHIGVGLVVLLMAKVVGTALVARIYTLCQPALMSMEWFVWGRGMILSAKDWAHHKLETWPLYRWMRRQFFRIKMMVRRIFRDAQELG